MKFIVTLLVLALIGFIAYLVIKRTIKNRVETITAYTGGLGSGKTLLSVETAKKMYFKQCKKWKRRRRLNNFLNFFRFKKKVFEVEHPMFFSNIPVRLNRKEWANQLTKEHLLLQERIPGGSVCLIDEIGSFASQFDYKEKNVVETFDEFCRFFRHYTGGPKSRSIGSGYIICNDQCSNNINLTIRRRLNQIHNLSNCFVLWRLCFYYERMINISEEIKTIDERGVSDRENDTQDNMTLKVKFLWHKKSYDTYCYSERYNSVPQAEYKKFSLFKTLKIMQCPKDKEKRYTSKCDNGND